MIETRKEEQTIEIFHERKVLQVAEIADLLSCSIPTARRSLKKWQTYTSYNHNGRFYTLPDIPEFDPFGLWKYEQIFFSKHGNLFKTVSHIVHESEAGLASYAIGEIVCLTPRSFLSKIDPVSWGMKREKVGGRFVYFSGESDRFTQQWQNRERMVVTKPPRLPSDADSVIILVEKIKHPELSIDDLANRVAKKGKRIPANLIQNLFDHHALLKKTEILQ